MKMPVYLDYAATTPVHPLVFEAMQPYFSNKFGNSSSGLHSFGWEAETALQNSREKLAELLHCQSAKEVFFTSGATESNNWALRGLVENCILQKEKAVHILTSPVEHNSVLKTLEHLARLYPQVSLEMVAINSHGQVDLADLQKKIRPETRLLSFMWVNNELGSFNPILEIGRIARIHKIVFHTDATQAVGKIPINFSELPIDLLSFSSHKIYGPKGVGGLLVRAKNPTISIAPLLLGGGQERGLRSGTANVAGIVGFARALQLMEESRESEWQRLTQIRKDFLAQLQNYRLNGHATESIPHILNLTFLQLKKYSQFPGFAISQGSACHSGSGELSHVLSALKFSQKEAENTFRISLGQTTQSANLQDFLQALKQNQILTKEV